MSQIHARDGHRCQYCGATELESGAKLHLDHLTPRSRGGLDAAENLVTACRSCNCSRGAKSLSQFCGERGLSARKIWGQASRRLPAYVAVKAALRLVVASPMMTGSV